MADLRNHECLSFGDALFLYLEREGMPLNVASVATLEGRISLDACSDFIESKLPLIPRYRQRVVAPPFNVGLPSWEYDPEFDIRHHIRELKLKRGTETELRSVAASILSVPMDRKRPLWDFTLLQGLKGDRTGLLVRVHHCLADGISGVGLMKAIMDPSPLPVPVRGKRVRFRTPKPRDAGTLLIDGVVTACFSAVQRVLTAQAEILDVAQQLAASADKANGSSDVGQHAPTPHLPLPASRDLARFVPELAAPTERLPFNVVCRGPQKFQWAEVPFADIKAVKHACGTSVNDVFLTIVTTAIRKYCELHGVNPARRSLRIIVPVSIRGKDQVAELGNRITFIPVPVPFGIRSPRRLLAAVRERTVFLKSFRLAEMVGFAGTLLGMIPTAVQAVVAPIASGLPISVGNLICTNVPGPHQPLYLLGHKMLSCYPYVPIGGEFGLNCAVLTYNGTAYFGFSGDAQAAPDLHLLQKYTVESFRNLAVEAGIRKPRPRRAPKAIATHLGPQLVPTTAEDRRALDTVTQPAGIDPEKEPEARVFKTAIGA